MLITVDRLRELDSRFNDIEDEALEYKINAIESAIRSYTHNNFQDRNVRFIAKVDENGRILHSVGYLSVGDTIEISNGVNKGVYGITAITDSYIAVNKSLYECAENVITKVKYPDDVIMGAINLLKWELDYRNKVGLKGETIARHSVTYFDMDANSINGYPSALLGFLKPYVKARF